MGKSARILGQENGLTAQEMNYLLKEEGYLDGKPGAYEVTEKGKKFASEQDHHRGTGGSACYNQYWTTRTWDESIMDEIDITPERKVEVCQAVAESRRMRKAEECVTDDEEDGYDSDDPLSDFDDSEDYSGVEVDWRAVLATLTVVGTLLAAPHIKKWWTTKVAPKIKHTWRKIAKKNIPSTNSDDGTVIEDGSDEERQ